MAAASSPKPSHATEFVLYVPGEPEKTIPAAFERMAAGRSATNDIACPADAGLSRQHLAFERVEAGYAVRDLQSKNGTFVNGERVNGSRLLAPGDRITAGNLVVVYRFKHGASTSDQSVLFVERDIGPGAGTVVVSTDLKGILGAGRAESLAGHTNYQKTVRALIRAGQELASHQSLDELFNTVLDLAVDAVGAARGVLLSSEGGQLLVRAAKGDQFQISSVIRERVLEGRESLLISDAMLDEALRARNSIVAQNVRSVMAVPLHTGERVLGLIYVDTTDMLRPFTRDDLGLLTVMANVAAIRIEHAHFAEMQQQQLLLERELAQAAEIQAMLLPSSEPAVPGLQLAGMNLPCRTVGGDYFDYIPYADGRVGIVIADVAGKGLPAALLMSGVQAYTRALAGSDCNPAGLVAALNRHIAERCPSNRFVTLLFAILDGRTGSAVYCNAGHNPGLLLRASGVVERLDRGGMVLGLIKQAVYEEATVHMEPGDALLLYTDGVTEACHCQTGEELGDDGLAEMLARCTGTATQIVERIRGGLGDWARLPAYADDVTIMAARRMPAQS